MPTSRARRAVPATRSSSRPTSPPTARRRRRSWRSCARTSSASRSSGSTRRTSTSTGSSRRSARCARLVAEIKERDRPDRLGRHRAEQARREGRSDAEKPAGFVVLSREEACARFARPRRRGLVPGHRAEDRRAAAAAGHRHARRARRTRRRALLAEHFGGNHGPDLKRRAQFHGSRTSTRRTASRCRSRARRRSTATSPTAELEGRWRRLAERALRAAGTSRTARGRTIAHQGPPRRLDHGDARADDPGADERRRRS